MTIELNLAVIVRQFLSSAVVVIFVSMMLNILSKELLKPSQKIKDAEGNEMKLLRMPQSFKWIAWGGIFFFSVCIVLSSIFPGGTKNLLFAQLVFAFFALLGGYLLYLTRLTISWNEKTLTAHNFWGTQQITLNWDEIQRITYHPMLKMFSFQLKNRSEKACVYETFEGIFDFIAQLVMYYRHLPLENATWDELKALIDEMEERKPE